MTRYDELLGLVDSPVVRLNRAVAVGEADGPLAGLAALDGLTDEELPATGCRPRAPSCWLVPRGRTRRWSPMTPRSNAAPTRPSAPTSRNAAPPWIVCD